jgi:hypothetical protein
LQRADTNSALEKWLILANASTDAVADSNTRLLNGVKAVAEEIIDSKHVGDCQVVDVAAGGRHNS